MTVFKTIITGFNTSKLMVHIALLQGFLYCIVISKLGASFKAMAIFGLGAVSQGSKSQISYSFSVPINIR
jgi:hypothetical protein